MGACPPGRRARHVAAVLVAIGLLVAAGSAVGALGRHAGAAEARRILAEKRLALARGERWSDATDADPNPSVSAPAFATAALIRAADAQATQDVSRRRALLADAMRLAEAALRRRPDWGEGLLVRAYCGSLGGGDDLPETRRAVARSYARASYLRDAASWRVAFGLRHWADLASATQARVIDELVWFARLRPETADQLFAAARATPAYVPLLLRWREVRALDADLATG